MKKRTLAHAAALPLALADLDHAREPRPQPGVH
jgi:hypothetical protein